MHTSAQPKAIKIIKDGIFIYKITNFSNTRTWCKYTNSMVNTIFGSGKKSCYAKFVLTKLVDATWRQMHVSEGFFVS